MKKINIKEKVVASVLKNRGLLLNKVKEYNFLGNSLLNLKIDLEFINSSLREIDTILYCRVIPEAIIHANYIQEFFNRLCSYFLDNVRIENSGYIMIYYPFLNTDWNFFLEEEFLSFMSEKLLPFKGIVKSKNIHISSGEDLNYSISIPFGESDSIHRIKNSIESLLGYDIEHMYVSKDKSSDLSLEFFISRNDFKDQFFDYICKKHNMSLELE